MRRFGREWGKADSEKSQEMINAEVRRDAASRREEVDSR